MKFIGPAFVILFSMIAAVALATNMLNMITK